MTTDLLTSFRESADEFLAAHPHLAHELAIGESEGRIAFPRPSESGFDVSCEVSADGRFVLATDHRWHDDGEGLSPDALRGYFAMNRDLLSPATRIREFRSAGQPYRWALEVNVHGRWTPERTTALIFWNYVGQRSSAVFQNHTLPARALHADGSVG